MISGILVENIRYRYSRKLSKIERLSPKLERILGIQVRILDHGKHAMMFLKGYHQQKTQIERIKDGMVKTALEAYLHFQYESILSLIQQCKEYEKVLSELKQMSMFETIKSLDAPLSRMLQNVHGPAEYFATRVDINTHTDALENRIPVHNLIVFTEECEKRLRRFLKR